MIAVKLAYYRKKDWKRFIKINDDKESMHSSWKEWHKDFQKMKKNLISEGYHVIDVEIDLDKLIDYCKKKGIKNDGKARSQFVQEI